MGRRSLARPDRLWHTARWPQGVCRDENPCSRGRRLPAIDDDFFLPELCESEALSRLVLLAELLVLVLVLAEPMLPGFDWVRLALTSLFVQWIVLLSALCSAACARCWRACGPWRAACAVRWWWC